ncbi:ABC transporter ATP-binding protein [Kibdelosporangium persicum]|uniref:ABC-type multidrug transport system fused ATPase/permease subunit n=1 Tax=Kibdelosporangium persicum TaxID=2698649 RepID=A0ABX2FHW2_9PSEU|nr:ABC transporter ATP-binding protein [Kibdelosporangium persicum]NRN70333.1 ABC-type multidrug transport system fused ATPase/permease subunit [Kibdelosporangium persicum]
MLSPKGGWRLFVLPVLGRHRRQLLVLAGWSVVEVLPISLSGWLVASALDRGFMVSAPGTGLMLLGCYGVSLVVGAFAGRQAVTSTGHVVESLRDDIVRAVVGSALQEAVERPHRADSSTVARLVLQAESVRQLGASLLMVARLVVFSVGACVIGLASLAPAIVVLSVLCMVLGAAVLVPMSRLWRRRYEYTLVVEERLARRAGRTVEGLRDALSCAAGDRAVAELDQVFVANAEADARVATAGTARIAAFAVAARIPLLALLILAPWLVSSGLMSAGALLGAATYLVVGLEPAVRTLVEAVGNLGLEMSVLLGRLAAHTRPPRASEDNRGPVERLSADVDMEGISFRYGEHSRPILDRFTLRIPAGEHLAIVGPSGIGKSTMAGLLTGLCEPETGVVRIGGRPLGDLAESVLRENVALVPQEAYVCAGTVRENLAYLNTAVDDATLWTAVTAVGAKELVDRLGGLGARIERPGALSPGERQLLVLARVFVSPARIVILDEATCHLDPSVEAIAESALADREGTLIVIAHRITSALRADRVLVLDGARPQVGTHAQLCTSSATYTNLVGHWQAVDNSAVQLD